MVCLLLQLTTLFSLGLDHFLDLIQFLLPLSDGVPCLTDFLIQVIMGTLLQLVLASCIVELVLHAFHNKLRSFTSVLVTVSCLDLELLVPSESAFQL